MRDESVLQSLLDANLNALTYVDDAGATGEYPVNPNGSAAHIAALTNAQGNVLGLMPHPESAPSSRELQRTRPASV